MAEEATRKKKEDFSQVTFFSYDEGLCVQCMHIGPNDGEPETVAVMDRYAIENGCIVDITAQRHHHEIYLSDPRKSDPSKLKTVIRHPIKKVQIYMKREHLWVEGIPALLWGTKTGQLFIAVHGDQSHKEDEVITIFAEEAISKGYQLFSFDLPAHGECKENPRLCKPQNCMVDLRKIMDYARNQIMEIGLFGCSIGAYFSMLAYENEHINQALFLSPVVDMARVIKNMMTWFDVSEERLEREQVISTPMSTLYWDYYQYVLTHPVKWNAPTEILYGSEDFLCEFAYVQDFAQRGGAHLTVMEGGEHFFHTDLQLSFFRKWIRQACL